MSRKSNAENNNSAWLKVKLGKIKPLTDGQIFYFDAINSSVITLCTGVAGTGKTYIALVLALKALLAGETKRIILSRPVVECGESLGFLPGTLEDKVEPYMLPFFDILKEFLTNDEVEQYLFDERIIIRPLAYMRGTTFSDAIVILDEAQNASYKQIKMLLTRLGTNSRIIVCGDSSQSDDIKFVEGYNPLDFAMKKIVNLDDRINLVYLTEKDIVRHDLVQKIISRMGE